MANKTASHYPASGSQAPTRSREISISIGAYIGYLDMVIRRPTAPTFCHRSDGVHQLSYLLGFVNSPVLVFRRTVEAIQHKVRRLGTVHHIMSRTCRDDDRKPI
jgi:hypothetical protein